MQQGFEIDQVVLEEKVKLNVKGLQTGRRTYGRMATGDQESSLGFSAQTMKFMLFLIEHIHNEFDRV